MSLIGTDNIFANSHQLQSDNQARVLTLVMSQHQLQNQNPSHLLLQNQLFNHNSQLFQNLSRQQLLQDKLLTHNQLLQQLQNLQLQ